MKQFFWTGIFVTIAFVACQSEAAEKAREEERINEEVERRIADYVQILQENCETKVLEAATRIADSLLIVEARLSTDTLFKPIKPVRPEKPEIQTLKDTVPIKPFLKPKQDTLKKQ